jgi:argininosuccinate lyase
MGYNRDTQWTKYWIMDLVDESKPALSVMADVIRLLRIDEKRMLEEAQKEFAGATRLMEWMVRTHELPLRKAKMVMEKAVKYSEKEGAGKVSYPSLKKALSEMNVNLSVTARNLEKIQSPEETLSETEKRVKEHQVSLLKRVKDTRGWLTQKRNEIEKAKQLVSKLEKDLGS